MEGPLNGNSDQMGNYSCVYIWHTSIHTMYKVVEKMEIRMNLHLLQGYDSVQVEHVDLNCGFQMMLCCKSVLASTFTVTSWDGEERI